MPLIECLTKHGSPEMVKQYEKLLTKGMSESDAAREIVLDKHKELVDRLNAVKKQAGLKQEKFVKPEYPTKAIEDAIAASKETRSQNKPVHEPRTEVKSEQPSPAETKPTPAPKPKAEAVPPVPKAPAEPTEEGSRGLRIVHEATKELREKHGMEAYQRKAGTVAEWNTEAQQRIEEGGMGKVVRKLEKGEGIDHIEEIMVGRLIATLDEWTSKFPTDGNLKDLKHIIDLSDRNSHSDWGKKGVAMQQSHYPQNTLASFMVEDMEANGVDVLTEAQKQQAQKEYEAIKAESESYKKEAEALREQAEKDAAEKIVLKQKLAQQKARSRFSDAKERAKGKNYKAERQEIKDAIKKKWNDANDLPGILKGPDLPEGTQGMGFNPLNEAAIKIKQLTAIAPDVAKLMQSYIEEGIESAGELVKKLHEDVKGIIPDVTEGDIRDILLGAYNEPKKTRKEVAIKVQDIKTELKYAKQLEALERGEVPASEKKKVQRNQRITDLRKQVKEHDVTKLAAYTKRLEGQAEALTKQLSEGDFTAPEKKNILDNAALKSKYPELYKKAIAAKDKLVAVQQKRFVRLAQIEYQRRSGLQKFRDNAGEILNLPRSIMSSMDYSAPLRQGLVAFTAHPITGLHAGRAMFKASFSQKYFDRWFYDLKEKPIYDIIKKSELSVTDPHDYRLSAKEEAFMNNLAEKIPIIGRYIKGSERAYVLFLNKMRVDLFSRYVDAFEDQGKTFENSPELYKSLAAHIGNITGRGKMTKMLENSAPLLNAMFFSPRLITSRLSLLSNWANPLWYKNTPKEIRVMYFKDMLKFLAFGASSLMLAKVLSGDESGGTSVEFDPRSTDFGKIKSGNTRWDVWGGFQQYVRLIAQVAFGEKKSTRTGEISELGGNARFGETRMDVLGRAFRSKLAPVPSVVWDLFSGRTVTGEKATLGLELQRDLLPLVFGDISDAYQDKGVSSLFTVGMPAVFGVGVQTFTPNKPMGLQKGAKTSSVKKTLK